MVMIRSAEPPQLMEEWQMSAAEDDQVTVSNRPGRENVLRVDSYMSVLLQLVEVIFNKQIIDMISKRNKGDNCLYVN